MAVIEKVCNSLFKETINRSETIATVTAQARYG